MKTDFVEIFQTIRAALQPYTANGFTARTNSDTVYELWSEKDVDIDGRKKDEVYFAGVKILKGHVGFYFMPVYAEAETKGLFHPSLLQLLKGKACFHIKKLDDILLDQITDALAKGFTIYKQKGWV
ncbi:DUF1801 domain-containing protein [Pedobacter sp. LMG 31464]|uniref:DUF1801 domain-containing protein n=1 Tax=Pedobacter planticolens TaxID=2679964 RepID=A0A923DW03_9SPHI|nr:DUF1801 domain-containing protein [Pedobacter planticolens]MBB2144979.1 DUF1801 domain-containing protein [Pedobacter planticolens]